MTSLLKHLSEEFGIPLSTLKLNARILRNLNLISYGSTRFRDAELRSLGTLILRLLSDEPEVVIMFSDKRAW